MAQNIFKVKATDCDVWVMTAHSLKFTDCMNDGAVYNTRMKAEAVIAALKKRHAELKKKNPGFEITFQIDGKWVFAKLPDCLNLVIEEYQYILVASY